MTETPEVPAWARGAERLLVVSARVFMARRYLDLSGAASRMSRESPSVHPLMTRDDAAGRIQNGTSWGAAARRRAVIAGAAVLTSAWAVGGEAISAAVGWGGNHLLSALSGLAFLWAGLFAIEREPRNRIGPLLLAYGVLWYLPFWALLFPPVLAALLPALAGAAGALLVHIGVAFPTGRIVTRFGRVVVAATYAWSVVIAVALDVTIDRSEWHCETLPYPCRSTLSLWPSSEVNATIAQIGLASNLVIIALTAAALWQRRMTSTAVERADQVPVWIAFAVLGITYAAETVVNLSGASVAVSDAVFELRVLGQLAAPLLIVYGLVHAQVAELARTNAELAETVRQQLRDVRASRARIVAAGDAERRRVERNIHDGAQQRLLSVILALRSAQREAGAGSPHAAATIAAASDELRTAVEELRELARGIRPSILADAGLGPAVSALADRAAVPVAELEVPTGRLPATVEATAYFVAAEALANVAKHANASTVSVRVQRDADTLRVRVADDGVGGADSSHGSGLRGLDDRVAALGGRLAVSSTPGAGTTVDASIPLAGEIAS